MEGKWKTKSKGLNVIFPPFHFIEIFELEHFGIPIISDLLRKISPKTKVIYLLRVVKKLFKFVEINIITMLLHKNVND